MPPPSPSFVRKREDPMCKIVIVFHSGYGHTAKVAQAVAGIA